ncbi:MAG: hypothetical protein COA42_19815, partial [Alteromonadaceae bacterium]
MSYLGLPRMNFAGAFFANPSNLNNYTGNYEFAATDQDLVYETGPYNNPQGVAQFYFRETKITQCVGGDGQVIADEPLDGNDIGTVNTWDAQTSADGKAYTLAKMVDIDPDMQFRSELYGIRIFVKTPDGYGFSGYTETPQLRDLYFARGAGSNNDDEPTLGYNKMQVACGTWHQRLYIDEWFIPEAGKSRTLDALSAGGAMELDIKLSVDMFLCDPNNKFTTGDMYCYGRLMGTIGAIASNMPKQIVPGRRMYAAGLVDELNKNGALNSAQNEGVFTREAGAKAAISAAEEAAPWNSTDACVQSDGATDYLIVDMGTTTPLKEDSPLGILDFGNNLTLGYLDGSDNFVAFASQGYTQAGSFVSVSDQLTDYIDLPGANEYRKSVYLKNAGVVQVALTAAEATILKSAQLSIQSNGQAVLKENPGGYYVNTETASCRLAPNSSSGDGFTLTGFQYGQPMSTINQAENLSLQITDNVVEYNSEALDFKRYPYSTKSIPTTSFTTEVSSEALSQYPGQFQMSISTGAGQAFQEKPPSLKVYNNWIRQPLDSLCGYIQIGSTGAVIGEPSVGPTIPAVT